MTLDATENPREALWAELVELAQDEASKGDCRALNVLRRLRVRMDGAPTASAPKPEDRL